MSSTVFPPPERVPIEQIAVKLYCQEFTGLLEQGAPLVWLASASHSSRVAAEVAAGHCDIEALVIAAPRETRKVPAKFAGRFAPGTLAAAWQGFREGWRK